MEQNYTIEYMTDKDWPEVAQIYQMGMDTGIATFEKSAPSWENWDADHLSACRLVIKSNGGVQAWAALSPVSGRCVYGGVAEVSIYVHPERQGQGLGSVLLARLIDESEKQGLWTLQAGVFPENKGSLGLHLKHDFRILGTRERIGKRDGVWKDNVVLERRSKINGID